MNLRFKNAYVLTLNEKDKINGEYVVKKNYEVLIDKNRIVFVGTKEETDEFILKSDIYTENYFKDYDCKENLLMPSFKNLHAHSAMNFTRGLADNLTLSDWLNKKIFPLECLLGTDDIYYFTELAILEYLQNGITCAFDMYFNFDEVVRAALDLDFRITLVDSVDDKYKNINIVEDRYNKYNKIENYLSEYAKKSDVDVKDYNSSLINYIYGMHSVYVNNDKTFSELAKIIHKYKAPFAMHNSETKKEVENTLKEYNKTPTELVNSYGLYDYGGYSYHNIYLSDNDIKIFKNKNIKLVSCNASNMKLKDGICDIYRYKNNGLSVSFGTDGAGSNNSLSIFREMYLASILNNEYDDEEKIIKSSDILDMACKNGVVGVNDDLDSIDIGKLADIILIDLHKANMWPLNNIISSLIYSANESNVIMTMIDGKILYDKSKFILPKLKHCIFEKSDEHNKIIQITKNVLDKMIENKYLKYLKNI